MTKEQGADHVLNKFGKRERTEIEVTLERAADAVEAIVRDGITTTMNAYNTAGYAAINHRLVDAGTFRGTFRAGLTRLFLVGFRCIIPVLSTADRRSNGDEHCDSGRGCCRRRLWNAFAPVLHHASTTVDSTRRGSDCCVFVEFPGGIRNHDPTIPGCQAPGVEPAPPVTLNCANPIDRVREPPAGFESLGDAIALTTSSADRVYLVQEPRGGPMVLDCSPRAASSSGTGGLRRSRSPRDGEARSASGGATPRPTLRPETFIAGPCAGGDDWIAFPGGYFVREAACIDLIVGLAASRAPGLGGRGPVAQGSATAVRAVLYAAPLTISAGN